MITQKLPVPCISQVFGKYTSNCSCSWCYQRFLVQLAEPDEVTTPYNPDLTVVLKVECAR